MLIQTADRTQDRNHRFQDSYEGHTDLESYIGYSSKTPLAVTNDQVNHITLNEYFYSNDSKNIYVLNHLK